MACLGDADGSSASDRKLRALLPIGACLPKHFLSDLMREWFVEQHNTEKNKEQGCFDRSGKDALEHCF